jgi:hypothetical protein
MLGLQYLRDPKDHSPSGAHLITVNEKVFDRPWAKTSDRPKFIQESGPPGGLPEKSLPSDLQ